MNGNQIPLVNSFYFKTPQVEKKILEIYLIFINRNLIFYHMTVD